MRPLAKLVGLAMAAYVRVVAATCRLDGAPPTQDQVVLAFWHEYNLAAAVARLPAPGRPRPDPRPPVFR